VQYTTISDDFQHFKDSYKYPGFRPLARVRFHPFDEHGRIVILVRRGKKSGLRWLREALSFHL
jgi:hypothetical protein